MATIAITGSASGIGAATTRVLEQQGDRVIGVDLRGAEIEADLSKPAGREAAVAAVLAACDGVLDGAVACAGIGGGVNPGALVVAVNYFGAVSFLSGVRPALARADASAAIAITSNSATLMPKLPDELLDSCLAGDEAAALKAGEEHSWAAYGGSKTALAHWLRGAAVKDDWIGRGICLNGVSPGRVRTALDDAQLADEALRKSVENLPIPVGRPGEASEIAEFLAFLLSDKGRFFCGSVLYQDGGTDALVRQRDWPVGITGKFPEILIPK